jgi:hypothetical protein
MDIDKMYKEILINEFETVIEKCGDAKGNVDDFLYFFSAAYGVVRRVLNFQCLPLLIFMHQVLNTTYNSYNQRWSNSTKKDTVMKSFPLKFLDILLNEFIDLTSALKNDDEEELRKSLENISCISYAMTGNGYYLYLGGKLKLEHDEG